MILTPRPGFFKRLPTPLVTCIPLMAFGLLVAVFSFRAETIFNTFLADDPSFAESLQQGNTADMVSNSCRVGQAAGAIFVLAGLLGLIRNAWGYWLARQTYIAVYDTFIYYIYVVARVIAVLRDAEDRTPLQWFKFLSPAGLAVFVMAAFHVLALRRTVANWYIRGRDESPALGDRILDVLNKYLWRPVARSSGASLAMHGTILFLPMLLQLGGMVTPYLVPFGKGLPDAGGGAQKKSANAGAAKKKTLAKIKIKKKPINSKLKGVIMSADAGKNVTTEGRAESLIEDLDQLTSLTYKADTNIVIGGQGTGTGGGRGPGNKAGGVGKGGVGPGGWPDGMKNSVVRFIRLEYNGTGWDDGMNATEAADVNFLQYFERDTGFKVAQKGESHPIRYLAKYDKGTAPPFVFMTGERSISVPPADMKALSNYCMDGGMLFADCGSPEWDRAFRSFIQATFPGKSLVDISDDDIIFQAPYVLPNGAPPLWHHGGNRSLGIKHNGRWIVFYHPGDLNDAWKTGHSGIDPKLAKGAFETGVNIVYYAFTNYLEQTKKYRK